MKILQAFNFRRSPYQRPQDDWICGLLAEGKPCPRGPNLDGTCPAAPVCHPARVDDRWECRRSDIHGGPCETGPRPDGTCCQTCGPCVPRPSLRLRRRRTVRWAVTGTIGLLLLVLGGSAGQTLLMPGPLASSHAGQTACTTCHAGAGDGALGWLHALVVPAGARKNAELCVTCHDVGPQPFAAHSQPVEELRKITQTYLSGEREIQDESWIHRVALLQPGSGFLAPRPGNTPTPVADGGRQIFCATCHEEHQGSFRDITEMSDARCQSCHVSRFGDFATSHPDFGNYPFERRTRIIFDHTAHFTRHFAKASETGQATANPPAICGDCHEVSAASGGMQTGSYEATCQTCHDGDILGTTRASGPKGINFVSVPGLDTRTLVERDIDIGGWPENSEAAPTAFMRRLLAIEPQGMDVLGAVDGLDLLDLRSASDEDLQRVGELAWAIKRLFLRLEKTRLSDAMNMKDKSAGMDMDHEMLTRLTGMMSHDIVRAANREWFPALAEDLERRAAGELTSAFTDARAALEEARFEAQQTAGTSDVSAEATASGDILETDANEEASGDLGLLSGNDDGGLLGLGTADDTPPGLLADESANAEPGVPEDGPPGLLPPGLLAETGDGDALGSDSSDSEAPGPGGEDILAGELEAGELLDNPDGPDDGPPGLLEDAASDTDIGLLGDEPGSLDAPPGLELAESEERADDGTSHADQDDPMAKIMPLVKETMDPEAWAEFGGWYRQDFTLRYRPTGHADRFLRAWLDVSGNAMNSAEEAQLGPVFDQLSPEGAVGRCTKCHSIDDESGSMHVKWRGFGSDRVRSRFTRFSHEPHIGAVGSEGCLSCHALGNATGPAYLDTFTHHDPKLFQSGFKPIAKATCATCHSEEAAGETCTLCHSYHASPFNQPVVQTRLPGFEPPAEMPSQN